MARAFIRQMLSFALMLNTALVVGAHGPDRLHGIREIENSARNERILVSPSGETAVAAEGVIWLEPGARIVVVLPNEPSPLLRSAAEDLQTYIAAASDARVLVRGESDAVEDDSIRTLIALGGFKGPDRAAPMPSPALAEDEFEIVCTADHPRKGATLCFSGASDRAVAYAAIEFLRRSLQVRWLPPRVYTGAEETAFEETQLASVRLATWPEGVTRCRPAIRERGVYTSVSNLTPAVINWMRHNRLNRLTVTPSEIEFPLAPDKDKQLRRMIPAAKQAGLQVYMLGFSFNVSEKAKRQHPEIVKEGGIDPALAITKEQSARLYADLVKRYDLDGFAWHPATEKVKVHASPAFKARPRPEWEAEYHDAYRQAIGAVRPGARLVAVMGWCDMEPAEAMAKLFPADTVAWIVPNTPIIDAANTDIAAFASRFPCWYWLYVSVSRDGSFPVVKTDYLETYCREAVARRNGLMPQCAFTANTVNLQYVADAAWDGPAPHGEYNRRIAELYFLGLQPAIEGLELYTQVTTRYRDWTNNLHTRAVKIGKEDFEALRSSCLKFAEAYREADGSALIRERLRDYAVAALRACKRYPQRDCQWYAAEWRRVRDLMGKSPLPRPAEGDHVGRVLLAELAEAEEALSTAP